MSKRRLSAEDIELWNRVKQTTERFHPERKEEPFSPEALERKPKPKTFQPQPFSMGQKPAEKPKAHDILPGIREQLAKAPLGMDAKAFGRLKRGKLKPEGKIDLHGKTLAQAHPMLTSFILRAQADGKRLVLVITGKGKDRDDGGPIPVRYGVLRHAVPQWLSTPPLNQMILQVSEAHLKHGGGGAYYVYLRRNR
ncbi:putative DNA endonuclease SmrA [Roseovarius albus]|uniref:Putative DNA endonuclease SmrA n=1 Tax=Roseovarius albus TaxID=1247867 RepID=A0A1X6Z544_9RHOB|nr:Smr/MutS family protein [Roseovarius albus]SLN40550.1 putative DNA endonuclease SmrA [Roseovarius albus]